MQFDHIKALTQVIFYQTQPGKYYAPRQIPPDWEEIEVITSGKGVFYMNGKTVKARPGSMIWLYGNEYVEARADEQHPYGTYLFRYASLKQATDRMPFHSVWEDISGCTKFCIRAHETLNLGIPREENFGLCTYARLIWEATGHQQRITSASTPTSIDRAMKYIEQHYIEPISIADIATAAGVSSSHLHMQFREYMQNSPLQYVLKKRLAYAQELLSSSSLSIKEICHAVGFSDIKNFCSYFKRNCQMTPGQYRHLTTGKTNSG